MGFIHQVKLSASEDRLEKLIQERLNPGSDKEAIDRRIWDLFGEEWAILFTDLSGFSRKVAEFGIIHFLQVIYESERLLIPCIDKYDGVLLKLEGDSMMIVFRRPEKAVECALSMQNTLLEYNKDRGDTEKVLLCVGIGYGKMLKIGDSDVYGSEVNAASKLGEDIAKAGEILVTGSLKNACSDMKKIKYQKISEFVPGAEESYKIIY